VGSLLYRMLHSGYFCFQMPDLVLLSALHQMLLVNHFLKLADFPPHIRPLLFYSLNVSLKLRYLSPHVRALITLSNVLVSEAVGFSYSLFTQALGP